jgi:hypothetical protein
MSLALVSKVAKPKRSRYPFLSRELIPQILKRRSEKFEAKNPSRRRTHFRFRLCFVCSEQTTNDKFRPFELTGGRNSRKIIAI